MQVWNVTLDSEIRSRIRAQALTDLSRIVVVDPEDAAVQVFNRAIQIEHDDVRLIFPDPAILKAHNFLS